MTLVTSMLVSSRVPLAVLDATRVSLDDEKDESDGGSEEDDSPNSESAKSKSEDDEVEALLGSGPPPNTARLNTSALNSSLSACHLWRYRLIPLLFSPPPPAFFLDLKMERVFLGGGGPMSVGCESDLGSSSESGFDSSLAMSLEVATVAARFSSAEGGVLFGLFITRLSSLKLMSGSGELLVSSSSSSPQSSFSAFDFGTGGAGGGGGVGSRTGSGVGTRGGSVAAAGGPALLVPYVLTDRVAGGGETGLGGGEAGLAGGGDGSRGGCDRGGSGGVGLGAFLLLE